MLIENNVDWFSKIARAWHEIKHQFQNPNQKLGFMVCANYLLYLKSFEINVALTKIHQAACSIELTDACCRSSGGLSGSERIIVCSFSWCIVSEVSVVGFKQCTHKLPSEILHPIAHISRILYIKLTQRLDSQQLQCLPPILQAWYHDQCKTAIVSQVSHSVEIPVVSPWTLRTQSSQPG